MKCLLLFLLIPVLSFAQDIPKGAEKIEIATTLPDSALFKTILAFLDDEKFVIDKSDAAQGSIVTEYQRQGKGYIHIRLIVAIKESKIMIRGQGMVSAMGNKIENEPLFYGGNSLQKKGFLYTDDIARALSRKLPDSALQYITKTN